MLLEPRPEVVILAPTLGHGQRVKKKTSPTSRLYPRPDGPSQGRLEVPLHTPRPLGQRLHPSLKLSPLVGLTTGGPSWENFITDGGEGLKVAGREDFKPEDPGTSDPISSE